MANIIGLTGQTGAGKSSVREILRQKGAAVIDADTVAHDITDNNVNCIYDIVNRFSCLVLNEKGKINRKALGKRVFSDKKELMALNKIIFPEPPLALHRIGIPGIYKVFHGTIKIQLAAVKSATAQPALLGIKFFGALATQ